MAKKRKTKSKPKKCKRPTVDAELERIYEMMARREPPPGSIVPIDMPIMRLVRG
jgi:hypothetical protein